MYDRVFWNERIRSLASTKQTQIIKKDTFLAMVSNISHLPYNNKAYFLDDDNFEQSVNDVTEFFSNRSKSFMIILNEENEAHIEILEKLGFVNTGNYQRMIAPVERLLQLSKTDKFLIKIPSAEEFLNDDILQISVENFPSFFPDLETARTTIKSREKRFQELDDVEVIHFVAYTKSEEPVATASIMYEDNLENLVKLSGASVLKKYRRQGIYTQLLQVRANHADQRGVEQVYVDANIETSRPILSKLGFKTIYEIRDFQYLYEKT